MAKTFKYTVVATWVENKDMDIEVEAENEVDALAQAEEIAQAEMFGVANPESLDLFVEIGPGSYGSPEESNRITREPESDDADDQTGSADQSVEDGDNEDEND